MPSRKATQSSSLDTVGSSPKTSSPTGAPAMASRSLLQGFVTVSLRRSTTGAEEELEVVVAAPVGVAAAVLVTVTAVRVCCWRIICLGAAVLLFLRLLAGLVLATLRLFPLCALPRETTRRLGILDPCGASATPRAAAAAVTADRLAANMLLCAGGDPATQVADS